MKRTLCFLIFFILLCGCTTYPKEKTKYDPLAAIKSSAPLTTQNSSVQNYSIEQVSVKSEPPNVQKPPDPLTISALKIGSDTAPVVIVEFADFQCVYCNEFHRDTYPLLKKEYIDSGNVQFIYHDYPLSIHIHAGTAALFSRCAQEQGKWEPAYNLLFEKQDEWAREGAVKLRSYALVLGLNTAKFNSCFDAHTYQNDINADFSLGAHAGLQGTPTFFIGKREGPLYKVVGAQPYENVKSVIDQVLSG